LDQQSLSKIGAVINSYRKSDRKTIQDPWSIKIWSKSNFLIFLTHCTIF